MTETVRPMLRRNLFLWPVVLYGLGTIIGAGIYLRLGEVARVSGAAAPTAFLVLSLLAVITALSFGELVSRFPQIVNLALWRVKGQPIRRRSASSVSWGAFEIAIVEMDDAGVAVVGEPR